MIITLFDKSFTLVLTFPIADSILPQFGSSANNAVLTNGEFATDIAISFANSYSSYMVQIDKGNAINQAS